MDVIDLMAPRDLVSPREGKRHGTNPPLWIGDEGFEESLDEVCDIVDQTELGRWPKEFLAKGNPSGLDGNPPELLKDKLGLRSLRPQRLALAVSMDKPWHIGEFLVDALLAQGATFKENRKHIQFCDMDNSYMAIMSDIMVANHHALDRVFDIKYYWRKPRPEDYKEISGAVFTVDGNGAPNHWAYGAGHGAYCGSTAEVILRSMDLTDMQVAWVLDATYQFAQARTLLGVHFWEDNFLGYNQGRERTRELFAAAA